jgi:hypothetical protein
MTAGMAVLAGTLAAFTAGSVIVCSEGAVRVDVREKTSDGHHVHLILPAAIAPAAAFMIPRSKLHDARDKIRPWLPTIKAASEELARCADGPLVEVDSHHDHVRIFKLRGSVFIDVDTDEDTVHVSFPLEAAADTVSQLAR